MARKKKKVIASEANNVEEGMEVHAAFGEAYYNGTVTSVEGDHFFADWHDGTNQRCSCSPTKWTAGFLPGTAKTAAKKTTKKKKKKPPAKKKKPAAKKVKKPTKKELAALAKKEKAAAAKELVKLAKARLVKAAKGDGNVPIPIWHVHGYRDLPDVGKHIIEKRYQNEKLQIGGATQGPHLYGWNFTEHIEYDKHHLEHGGSNLCRLLVVHVKKGHASFPPKNVDLVLWGVKIPVDTRQSHRRLGGEINGDITFICTHFCERKAAQLSVFELRWQDIESHDMKLKFEYGEAVDIVSKIDERVQ